VRLIRARVLHRRAAAAGEYERYAERSHLISVIATGAGQGVVLLLCAHGPIFDIAAGGPYLDSRSIRLPWGQENAKNLLIQTLLLALRAFPDWECSQPVTVRLSQARGKIDAIETPV